MEYDNFYARSSYESLILRQPQIEFDGLWEAGNRYFILCRSLDGASIALDGKPLIDWFNGECKILGSPVSIVQSVPEGATRVPERTATELSLLHGEPLTALEVYREVASILPSEFPLVGITSPKGRLKIEVSRNLTSDEINELEIALGNFKIEIGYDVVVNENNERLQKAQTNNFLLNAVSDNLALQPARAIPASVPSNVIQAYSEDSDFWVDNRVALLSGYELTRDAIIPKAFDLEGCACFIEATAFDTSNLRTYLTMYSRIIIAMPLKDGLLKALAGFGVTREELVELVARGRVQFILPQPIERYDCKFLADVLAARSSSVLFSRKLCAASIVETRSRIPFLYPSMGANDRRAVVEALMSVRDPQIGGIARNIAASLGAAWVGMERSVSTRGAMGNMAHGVGAILGSIASQVTGRDLSLELIMASTPVEWAAALRATYFPFENADFSNYPAASLCASLYSGVRNSPVINPIKDFHTFVDGILCLDNNMPILELEAAMTKREVGHLADLLNRTHDPEQRNALIKTANDEIKQFERNTERLNRTDIFSLGGVVAGAVSGNVFIPLGVWIAQYILCKADPGKDFGGRALDWLRAVNAYTSADIVLLSRVRNKIAGNK